MILWIPLCIGDSSDAPLIKRSKYEINMDVGCMVDWEWIESLETNNADGQRKDIINDFITYCVFYEETGLPRTEDS